MSRTSEYSARLSTRTGMEGLWPLAAPRPSRRHPRRGGARLSRRRLCPLGRLRSSLSYGASLRHYFRVDLLVHQVGGGLLKGRMVPHEQDECDAGTLPSVGLRWFCYLNWDGACLASGRIPWACGTPYEVPRTPLPPTGINKDGRKARDPPSGVPGLAWKLTLPKPTLRLR